MNGVYREIYVDSGRRFRNIHAVSRLRGLCRSEHADLRFPRPVFQKRRVRTPMSRQRVTELRDISAELIYTIRA